MSKPHNFADDQFKSIRSGEAERTKSCLSSLLASSHRRRRSRSAEHINPAGSESSLRSKRQRRSPTHDTKFSTMSSPVVVLLLSLVVAAAMIGGADGACETAFTHEGYIIDTLCWQQPGHVAADGAVMDTNPEDHTRKCLLMPPCIQSGYTILEQGADGKYFPLYTLDAASNAMAVAFFENETKEDGYKVTTEGFACDDGTVTLSTIALATDEEGDTTMDEMDKDMGALAGLAECVDPSTMSFDMECIQAGLAGIDIDPSKLAGLAECASGASMEEIQMCVQEKLSDMAMSDPEGGEGGMDEPGDDTSSAFAAGYGLVVLGALVNYLLL